MCDCNICQAGNGHFWCGNGAPSTDKGYLIKDIMIFDRLLTSEDKDRLEEFGWKTGLNEEVK